MKMQDKEFDQLFHSKLDDMELEPSPSVWSGIADKLDSKKPKRILMPFLSIAASIIVLVTAGILFIPTKQKATKQQPVQNKIAKNNYKTKTQEIIKETIKQVIADEQSKNAAVSSAKHAATLHKSKINKVTTISEPRKEEMAKVLEPVKVQEQPVIANVTPQRQNIPNAVVPDITTPLAINSAGIEPETLAKKPSLLASQQTAKTAKKHGIRNLGDLINVVVAKIDKRQDKVIEFTDNADDDSGADITGINLGIIKIKKEK